MLIFDKQTKNKMEVVCKLFQVWIPLGITFLCGLSANNVNKMSLSYKKSFLLEGCQAMEQDKIEWKFQETLLFTEGFLVRDEFSANLFLLRNSSLYINPVSLIHIGKYDCVRNYQTVSTYFVDVEGLLPLFCLKNVLTCLIS